MFQVLWAVVLTKDTYEDMRFGLHNLRECANFPHKPQLIGLGVVIRVVFESSFYSFPRMVGFAKQSVVANMYKVDANIL